MANEFIARKGLIALDNSSVSGSLDVSGSLTIESSGSTLFEVIGSEGQLFSITDSLSGSLFAVSDVSGLPILEVFSDDTVKIGSFNNEAITVSGSHTTIGGILAIPGFTNVSASLAAGSTPAGTISSSAQVDHDQTTNFSADEHFTQANITTVGTVTSGDVSAILPSGTVSGSTQTVANLDGQNVTVSSLTVKNSSTGFLLKDGTGTSTYVNFSPQGGLYINPGGIGNSISASSDIATHGDFIGESTHIKLIGPDGGGGSFTYLSSSGDPAAGDFKLSLGDIDGVGNTTTIIIDDGTEQISLSKALSVTGNITVTGTVDGVDIASLESSVQANDTEIASLTAATSSYLTTVDISDDTNLTAGNGITLTGDTLTVTAGTGLTQNAGGLAFDADGGTLTTNNADVDHILINDGGTFKRITKGNINVGDFNNDAGYLTSSPFTAAGISGSFTSVSASLAADIPTNNNQLTNGAGYTTNTGTVTSVGGTGTVSGLSLSGTVTTSGNLTLGGTISLVAGDIPTITSAKISDVDAFSQTGTYASLRAQGTTAGDVGLGNVTNESKATMFTSPTFTGTTAAPTPSTADDSTKIATTAYVQANLDNLIGNAGAALDTLGELSASLADATGSIESLVTEIDGKLAKASNLSDLTNTTTARTNLGVDAAGTDNSTNVTLAGTPNYITISGQQITRNQIDLTTDVTGQLPAANLGTITSAKISDVDAFSQTGTYTSLRAQGTTAADVGLGNVENTALSTYTGNGGALDNQYITNGAGYTTNTGTVTSIGGTGTVSGLSLSGTVTTSGNLTLGGTISISSTNITDVDAFSQTGTYASLRAQGTTAGDVGLGNVTNESKSTMFASPTFTGTVAIPGFTDVSASLAAAVAGGDNLGNHTATTNLNMDSNNIINVGNIDGVDVSTLKSDFDTLEGKTLVSGSAQIDLGSATGTATNASTASYVAGSNVDGTVASATISTTAINSTNASNIDVNNVSGNSEYGLVFRDGNGDGNQALYADSELDQPSYNPSTNTIKTPIISASSALYVGGDITATGTITGNSIAGTLATAAQTNITSVGTLTSLTVDDININASNISSTADTDVNLILNNSGIFFEANTGDNFYFNQNQNDTDFQVYSQNDENLIYGDSSTDKVGIGTSTPSEKLTVEGNISASGDLSIQGFTSVSASLAAASGGGGGAAFPFTGSAEISGSLEIVGSGSNVFNIEGSLGQLFSVSDNFSGSLFKVATISGTPVLEAFSDNIVKIGKFNDEAITVSGSHTTIGGILAIPGFSNVSASLAAASGGGGGNVSNTGTPVNDQIAVWTDATTVEGTTKLTFENSTITVHSANADNTGIEIYGGVYPTATSWISPIGASNKMNFGDGTSGHIFDFLNNKIAFDGDSTNTYIQANTDTPEDLEIHADQDIILAADNAVVIGAVTDVEERISSYRVALQSNCFLGQSTKVYLPFNSLSEQSGFSYLVLTPAAANGRLVSITIWSTSGGGSTEMGLHINSNATAASTDTQTLVADVPTTFTFSSGNTFSQNDELSFSIDPTSNPNGISAQIILEYDY